MASLPPRSSFPSSTSEPAVRRLGVRSSAHLEKPIRAQIVIISVSVVLFLSLPIYLLRRPDPEAPTEKEVPSGFAPRVPVATPDARADRRVVLAKPIKVRCGASAVSMTQEGALCDDLQTIEAAVGKAVIDTVDCSPRTGEEGSLNYVVRVDFGPRTLHVFPGASGTWKGPQAKRAAQCVKQALSAPEWDKITHKYQTYEIAIMATYRSGALPGQTLFE